MNQSIFARRRMHLLLAAAGAGLAITISPAIAQPMEEVVVSAPPVYQEITGRPSSTTGPSERITVTHYISYADLDLKTQAGVAELESRVKSSAKTVCEQLDKLYPLIRPDQNCVRKAADGGMEQVHKAVAAAEHK